MGHFVWDVECRGGAYDGLLLETALFPEPVLIVWRCSRPCLGHGTFVATNPDIVLATAEAYRRVELDESRQLAVYEIGERPSGPGVEDEERELVGAGGDRA